MNKRFKHQFCVSLFIFTLFSLAACEAKPVCPPSAGPAKYLSRLDLDTLPSSPVENSSPVEVKINGKMMMVDKVVTGPLCHDKWQGSVYVGCDVQVFEWKENPFFLKDCNLTIEPGTVVYVAAHNDAAYYQGCSCHTGEQP